MVASKTIDNIEIKNKMSNPSQEPAVSFKAPNHDLEGMDVIFTLKIKTECQNSEHEGDHIKIMIKIPNHSQEPQASSKAPNQDLKDMDVLCTFKIKIESQNLDQLCIKDH